MRTSQQSLHARLIELLKDRSVQEGSFTLASGLKSSYYVDARKTTMSATGLSLIGTLGLERIRQSGWQPSLIGGLTLGADPIAYSIALASLQDPPSIDAFTVRKRTKKHGTGKRIEGCFETGSAVVVVEDVITTGRSALQAIEVLREAGAVVLGVLALVDRQEGGRDAIEELGCQVQSMVTLGDLDLKPSVST